MKNPNNKSTFTATVVSFALLCFLNAGAQRQGFVNDNDIFGTRVFIENKGQFDNYLAGETNVHYLFDHAGERIYFTEKGLVYEFIRHKVLSERERERMKNGGDFRSPEPERYFVKMSWSGCNENIEISGSEKQGHYFTYGYASLNSYGYKKLLYKNVYNNIDIEYTLPADKSHGVKYNVILHPGADIEDLKIVYSGDVNSIKLSRQGKVIVKTPIDEIHEHAPKSFLKNGAEVETEFSMKKNVIGFSLGKGFQAGQELTIDPWVVAVSTLSNINYGYDIDYDDGGNVFVYGGNVPAKIAKYNSGGTLIWTFPGNVALPTWSGSPTGNYIGNFVVIKTSGKCYTGQGFNSSGTQIIRLDQNGNYDNLITPQYNSWREVWDMAYHCSTGNVYGMGGSTTSNQSAGIVNQTTGSLTPIGFFTVTGASSGNDVVCHAIDDGGEFFWNYAGPSNINNKIARINSAFTSSVWMAPSTFNAFTECANKNAYVAGPGNSTSNGFNCLAVNGNYLFYYDGLNMATYDKSTGALVANTTIPGHTIKQQGGIAVDDCNNIYIGGNNNNVLSYHFNGNTFSSLASISMNATSNNKFVYDIKLDRFNKLLYVCGSGFVGTYNAVNTTSCGLNNIICYNPLPVDYVICAGSNLTVVPVNYVNLTNPTYSMNPGGFTSNNGTIIITPSVNTSYTTYITGTTTNNAVATLTAQVNVTVNIQPLTAVTLTQTTCTSTLSGFDLGLSFFPAGPTPGYTITWQPSVPNGVFSPTQTSAYGAINAGTYTATIISSSGCSTVSIFTINAFPDPAIFNINPPGNNYIINCYTPTLNLSFTPASYNYTCTNGVSASQTGTSAAFTNTNYFGTWTCTAISPTSGCTTSQTFVINQNTLMPSASISPTFQNITCSVTSVITVTAVASPTVNIEHQWMSPLGGTLTSASVTDFFVPGGPGTYTHSVMDKSNGCKTSRNFTVFSNAGFPTFSLTSPQNFTLGCSTKSVAEINITMAQTTPSAGGAVSYTLLGPGTSTAIPNGTLSQISHYSVTTPGNYTVVTRDNVSLCATKVYVSVLQNTVAPGLDSVIVPRDILDCAVPTVTLDVISKTDPVSYLWTFPGNPNSLASHSIVVNANTLTPTNTLIANYTITLTDDNNLCKNSKVVTMLQNLFPPKVSIASGPEISCKTESVLLTNNALTTIPPYFNPNLPVIGYEWSGPSPQPNLQVNSTYLGWLPGTYTMVAKDLNNGCMAVGTKSIADGRLYPVVNNPDSPEPYILDCGATGVRIWPIVSNSLSSFSYSWEIPPGVIFSGEKTPTLTTSSEGQYVILVHNPESGCTSAGMVSVIQGSLNADFEPDRITGFAPLSVTFKNESSTSLESIQITSVWSFGNGKGQVTTSTSISPKAEYTQPGTYKVTMYAGKGTCIDSITKYIKVEMPSELNIPNVFSPNNDGINDVYFLKTTNLTNISIVIYDRWAHKVYEVESTKGNIAWDGKNQFGKDVADGVYFYILNAKGSDGADYHRTGNITLVR